MNIIRLELNIANTYHITNSYIVYDENKDGIVIDPGDEFIKIKGELDKNNIKVKYIILTHAHFDHVNALYELQKYTNAMVLINKNEYDMLTGIVDNAASFFASENTYVDVDTIKTVKDGEKISVGNMNFKLVHTPGHTAGSMIIVCDKEKIIFTGDTLFEKEYGRCDLETGSFKDMVDSLRKIFGNYSIDTLIYPGHGKSSNLEYTKKYISLLLAMKNIKL